MQGHGYVCDVNIVKFGLEHTMGLTRAPDILTDTFTDILSVMEDILTEILCDILEWWRGPWTWTRVCTTRDTEDEVTIRESGSTPIASAQSQHGHNARSYFEERNEAILKRMLGCPDEFLGRENDDQTMSLEGLNSTR